MNSQVSLSNSQVNRNVSELPTIKTFYSDIYPAYGIGYKELDFKDFQISCGDNAINLAIDDKKKKLSKSAIRTIRSVIGFNLYDLITYADDPDLVERIFTYHRKKFGNLKFSISYDDEQVLTIKREAFLPVEEVIKTLIEIVPASRVVDFYRSRNSYVLKIITEIARNPATRPGDLSHSGLFLSVNGCVHVSPFVYRLVCSNGLITENCLGNAEVNLSDNLKSVLSDSVHALSDFVELVNIKVDSPAEFVARIANEKRIPFRYIEKILRNLASMEGDTAYDLVNSISFISSASGQRSYEHIAGLFMSSVVLPRCSQCKSVLIEA